jgi:competence protein ComEA
MKTNKIICIMTLLLMFSLLASVLYAEEDNKINLNSATVEELAKVPGLNKELAEKIVAVREENGEFVDMEELLDIDGIDMKLLRQLKKHIKVEELDGCNC